MRHITLEGIQTLILKKKKVNLDSEQKSTSLKFLFLEYIKNLPNGHRIQKIRVLQMKIGPLLQFEGRQNFNEASRTI